MTKRQLTWTGISSETESARVSGRIARIESDTRLKLVINRVNKIKMQLGGTGRPADEN